MNYNVFHIFNECSFAPRFIAVYLKKRFIKPPCQKTLTIPITSFKLQHIDEHCLPPYTFENVPPQYARNEACIGRFGIH